LLGWAKPFQRELKEIADRVQASTEHSYKLMLTGNAILKLLGLALASLVYMTPLQFDFHGKHQLSLVLNLWSVQLQ
jgi:hypothetical protein